MVGLYISNFSIPPILITLFISLVFISIVEFIRLRHPRFEALFEKNVGFLMRESEKVFIFLQIGILEMTWFYSIKSMALSGT